MGLLGSAWFYGSGARMIAEKVVSNGTHDYQNVTNTEYFMSRDEFVLYDTFKSMAMVKFLGSLMVLALGKIGIKSIRREKANVTKRIISGTFWLLIALIITTCIYMRLMKPMMKVMEKYPHHGWSHSHTQNGTQGFWGGDNYDIFNHKSNKTIDDWRKTWEFKTDDKDQDDETYTNSTMELMNTEEEP